VRNQQQRNKNKSNTWKLDNMLLSNMEDKGEISRETRYIELNKHKKYNISKFVGHTKSNANREI
jgi:hypothetical protein